MSLEQYNSENRAFLSSLSSSMSLAIIFAGSLYGWDKSLSYLGHYSQMAAVISSAICTLVMSSMLPNAHMLILQKAINGKSIFAALCVLGALSVDLRNAHTSASVLTNTDEISSKLDEKYYMQTQNNANAARRAALAAYDDAAAKGIAAIRSGSEKLLSKQNKLRIERASFEADVRLINSRIKKIESERDKAVANFTPNTVSSRADIESRYANTLNQLGEDSRKEKELLKAKDDRENAFNRSVGEGGSWVAFSLYILALAMYFACTYFEKERQVLYKIAAKNNVINGWIEFIFVAISDLGHYLLEKAMMYWYSEVILEKDYLAFQPKISSNPAYLRALEKCSSAKHQLVMQTIREQGPIWEYNLMLYFSGLDDHERISAKEVSQITTDLFSIGVIERPNAERSWWQITTPVNQDPAVGFQQPQVVTT
jgi:hypothetical protein